MDKNRNPFKDISELEFALPYIKKSARDATYREIVSGVYETTDQIVEQLRKYEDYDDPSLDPANMVQHDPSFFGVDLRDYIAMINKRHSEYLMYLIIDLDEEKVVANKTVTDCSPSSVSLTAQFALDKFLFDEYDKFKEYALIDPTRYVLVDIHNHPNCVAAMPSVLDEAQMLRRIVIMNGFMMSYGDSMIVTPYDCFSEYQHEEGLENGKRLIRNERVLWDKEMADELEKYDVRLKHVPMILRNRFSCNRELYRKTSL